MFSPEQYYEAACSGEWADPDPAVCGCRGRGWKLSAVDTWHKCRYHGKGVRHPEDDDGEREAVAPAADVDPDFSVDSVAVARWEAEKARVVVEDDDLPW